MHFLKLSRILRFLIKKLLKNRYTRKQPFFHDAFKIKIKKKIIQKTRRSHNLVYLKK